MKTICNSIYRKDLRTVLRRCLMKWTSFINVLIITTPLVKKVCCGMIHTLILTGKLINHCCHPKIYSINVYRIFLKIYCQNTLVKKFSLILCRLARHHRPLSTIFTPKSGKISDTKIFIVTHHIVVESDT